MKKRILSAVLCATVVAGLLAGCSSEKGGNASSGTSSLDMNKKPDLKLLMPYVPFDPNTEQTAKIIEEGTGYKVTYDLLPAEDPTTKLNTIIASKQPYDIMVLTKADFDNSVGTGAYESLNDLLPKYAPDLQKKTAEGLWTNTTIDGKILGVPEGLANENGGTSFRVRTDLLKKAGIDKMPETIDEFYNALKAIKTKLNIIPLTSNDKILPEVASAFGTSVGFTVIDGEVVHVTENPGTKAYVEFMHKLFKEGLIDNEWAQNDGSKMKEKFFTSKAAIYRMAWWDEPTATKTILEKAPDATFDYLPPLKDANGKAMLKMGRGTNRVTVLPKVGTNKEYALDFMNKKVADELFKKITIGEKDVHFKEISKDEYEPILPKFFEDKNNSHYYLTGSDTKAYSFYWSQTRVKKDATLYKEFNKIQQNVHKATVYYDPTTYMEPNVAYTKTLGKLNKQFEDGVLQFITGARPLTEWDKFISEYNAAGGTEQKKIVKDWWAANKAELADKQIMPKK